MSAVVEQPWFLNTSYPVLLPPHDALTKPQDEFDSLLASELGRRVDITLDETPAVSKALTDASDENDIKRKFAAIDLDPSETDAREDKRDCKRDAANDGPFMLGLLSHGQKQEASTVDTENKMLTDNGDVAFRSTTDPLVDLFSDLGDAVSGPHLRDILEAAWAADSLSTLKIIFNARSIHLGKGSKNTFYRAAGWLAQNHPLTLVANLKWLSRPVIKKKVKKEVEDDFIIVEAETDGHAANRFDVKHGVAHGYWKDFLNILALAVNKKLHVLANPRDLLNIENKTIKKAVQLRRMKRAANMANVEVEVPPKGSKRRATRGRGGGRHRESPSPTSPETACPVPIMDPDAFKRLIRNARHRAAVEAFENDVVYRSLHLTVARLFAEQLQSDIAALRGSDANARKQISLCGKWAPSHDRFHDRHTFVTSSIAEIMYPRESFDNVLSATDGRETYIRHAREQYRIDVSALRKHLAVVERDITANSFANIKYGRVPSIAMQNYSKLFIQKDFAHFENYIDRVAEGKARISGATLLPSILVQKVQDFMGGELTDERLKSMTPAAMVACKIQAMEAKVIDGQWKTLVRRIKDSGTLSSSIAICDVSASMTYTTFRDQTCPMDAAVGLALLVAEVTEPPFGGAFITFHSSPEVQKIDISQSFKDKARQIRRAPWGGNTDFVATFEKLILPMAIENKLKQEDMVKRVFVFSDMQFDAAQHTGTSGKWSSSFERIKKQFDEAGYEMPELSFWNLAGGRASHSESALGDSTAPKPVTAGEAGTALVSGYSPGMMKVFMDDGSFEDPDEDDGGDEKTDEDRQGERSTEKKDVKKDPMAMVKRAIGHKAYNMLAVLD